MSMTEVSPVKTPNRSIIRPLEVGSITPSAIEELSSQIDSLLQRGRKLRDLKNSMTRSPPRSTLQETRDFALDPRMNSIGLSNVPDPLEDVLAVINASDPLFMEEARVPPKAACENLPKLTEHKPLSTTVALPPLSRETRPCSYSISESFIADRRVVLRLRSKSDVSTERVAGDTNSNIAVEAWRGSDLVGIGRKQGEVSIPSKIPVDIWDVWEGTLVGKVILEVGVVGELNVSESPVIMSETSIIAPLVEPIFTPSLELVDPPKQIFKDFILKPKPPVIEKSVQSSPRLPPPTLRVSTESIVSFLSESPNRKNEELTVSEDSEDDRSVSNLSRVMEEEAIAHVQSELSTASDLREVLQRRMQELDLITSRLTEPFSPRNVTANLTENETESNESTTKPVRRKTVKPNTRRRRRRVFPFPHSSNQPVIPFEKPVCSSEEQALVLDEKSIIPSPRVLLPPLHSEESVAPNEQEVSTSAEVAFPQTVVSSELNGSLEKSGFKITSFSTEIDSSQIIYSPVDHPCPNPNNLSVVRSSLVAIGPALVSPPISQREEPVSTVRLSSKRKESIEKARRTISKLRQSFLKDVAALTQGE